MDFASPPEPRPDAQARRPYAVRALLLQEGKILLIRHAADLSNFSGKWTFPGGRLDPHETDPLVALRREIREELSVEIEVLAPLGLFYSRAGLEYAIFVSRPIGPIGPLQSAEIRQTAWLTPAEVYEWYTREKLQFGFEMQAISAYLKKLP